LQYAYRDDELETALEIYKDDLELEVQLLLRKPHCKGVCNELATYFSIHDPIQILSQLSVSETAFSGVWKAGPALSDAGPNAWARGQCQT